MRFGHLLFAASGVALAACHTIYEELPVHNTGSPVTNIVVTSPTVNPTPVPVTIPQPSATNPPAANTPAPVAATPPPSSSTPPPSNSEPSAGGGSCRLPPGTGSGVDCPRRSGSFDGELESSIDALIREQPSIFSDNGTRVVDQSRYISGLISQLNRRGLCAHWDGEEMAIKNTNSFSDQYSVVSSSLFVRRGSNVYRATCSPAWF